MQRGVRFHGPPAKISVAIEHVPVFIRNGAVLIACPANIGIFQERRIRKDQSVGLVDAEAFENAREIVDVAGAARSIQPELHEVAVAGAQFIQFRHVVIVVLGGVGIFGFMTIPGRKINAESQAGFSGRFGDLAHHVTFAVLPGAAFHAVVGLRGWPQTETIVVLGHEDDILCASGFDGAHPLIRIKLRGREYLRVGGAVAPLAV